MEVYEIGITSWLVSGDLVGKPHLVDEKLGDYTNQYTVLLGIIIRIHERGSPFFEYCSFFCVLNVEARTNEETLMPNQTNC